MVKARLRDLPIQSMRNDDEEFQGEKIMESRVCSKNRRQPIWKLHQGGKR